jgi:hypothetical protein
LESRPSKEIIHPNRLPAVPRAFFVLQRENARIVRIQHNPDIPLNIRILWWHLVPVVTCLLAIFSSHLFPERLGGVEFRDRVAGSLHRNRRFHVHAVIVHIAEEAGEKVHSRNARKHPFRKFRKVQHRDFAIFRFHLLDRRFRGEKAAAALEDVANRPRVGRDAVEPLFFLLAGAPRRHEPPTQASPFAARPALRLLPESQSCLPQGLRLLLSEIAAGSGPGTALTIELICSSCPGSSFAKGMPRKSAMARFAAMAFGKANS